jgi:hypothetical protein
MPIRPHPPGRARDAGEITVPRNRSASFPRAAISHRCATHRWPDRAAPGHPGRRPGRAARQALPRGLSHRPSSSSRRSGSEPWGTPQTATPRATSCFGPGIHRRLSPPSHCHHRVAAVRPGPRRPLLAPCIMWPRWALDRDHLFGGRRGPLLPMVVEGSSDEGLASRREWSLAPTEGHPAPQPPIQSRTSFIREAPSWTLTSGTVPRSRSR